MKKIKQRQSRLVIKRIKAKSGADAVAKKFGEDKEFRTRVMPNKKYKNIFFDEQYLGELL